MSPRTGEDLDVPALASYLRGRIAGAGQAIEIEQFPGGHSNLTYLVRAGGHEYVLRRPPVGPVALKAHDMAREYNVLRAVHPLFPPAPAPILLCEDPGVIGAVFFLMEHRRGIVLRGEAPPGIGARVSAAFVDCLARLHAVPVSGLSLGRPEGFLERQVRGWAERWQRARTEDLPLMDQVIGWLLRRLPSSPDPSLVHNDFKLDNIMLDAADPGRVEAVLDWEMTTVGDPLVDLGCTLCYWSEEITAQPGWYSRARLLEEYARQTGRDLTNISYYEVFGFFKVAVVLQQIYFRYRRGQTHDGRFREFDKRVRGLVETAGSLAEKAG